MPRDDRNTPSVVCFLALAGVCLTAFAGCGPAASPVQTDDHGHSHDHDHGHKPESLHEAVAELTSIREEIRAAILDGDPDDAHGPLHEVGELLEAIPDIAAETDLPEEEWGAVNAANERLFDAFGAIDKAFHTKDGDKQAAYEQVAGELEEAIEEIRSRLPMTGEDPAADDDHDHDHDHDDHSESEEPAASSEAQE